MNMLSAQQLFVFWLLPATLTGSRYHSARLGAWLMAINARHVVNAWQVMLGLACSRCQMLKHKQHACTYTFGTLDPKALIA